MEKINNQTLLQETLYVLNENGKTPNDVLYVTDGQNWCYWNDFALMSSAISYDSGYGTAEININLEIVGDTWWLERDEYDGSEWWSFKSMGERPEKYKAILQIKI